MIELTVRGLPVETSDEHLSTINMLAIAHLHIERLVESREHEQRSSAIVAVVQMGAICSSISHPGSSILEP